MISTNETLSALPPYQAGRTYGLEILLYTLQVMVDGTSIPQIYSLLLFFSDQDFSSNSNLKTKIITLDPPQEDNFLPFQL